MCGVICEFRQSWINTLFNGIRFDCLAIITQKSNDLKYKCVMKLNV